MGTNKLFEKLEEFFGLTEKKQLKKRHKFVKIIHELENKKSKLERKAQIEREIDASSSRYQDLELKILVVSGLINKAKQKNLVD